MKKYDLVHGAHGPNIFDPNCRACRKYGMLESKTVNRHLLDIDDPCCLPEEKLEEQAALKRIERKTKPKYGYHAIKIKKGVLGEVSKIREEVEELEDAERQGVRILIMCELADIFGAVRAYALRYGLKMSDLHAMAKLTRNAFDKGQR
jgi:hypothetical protein